ncbi:hypothetical protein ACFL5B_00310 [Candidatus Latescibacterota bacterium]
MILCRIEPQSLNLGKYLGKQHFVFRNLSHLKRNVSTESDYSSIHSSNDSSNTRIDFVKRPLAHYLTTMHSSLLI